MMKRPELSLSEKILFLAVSGACLCLPAASLFWREGCSYLSLSIQQEQYRQTNQNPPYNTCWDDEKSRRIAVFIGDHPTDVLLSLFTGLLVIVGGWQGYQLRRTVESVEVTAERQLRAYVSVEPGEIKTLAIGAETVIEMIITNHGQTPAHKTVHYGSVEILRNPLPLDFRIGEPDKAADSGGPSIPEATSEPPLAVLPR